MGAGIGSVDAVFFKSDAVSKAPVYTGLPLALEVRTWDHTRNTGGLSYLDCDLDQFAFTWS